MLELYKHCLALKPYYNHVENDGSYYVVRDGDTLVVFFEWSNGKTDWKNNFNFPARPYRKMGKGFWFCHRGFLRVWKSIEPYIADSLMDPTITHINIVGYSHGGAIAQLCYEYVKFNRPDVNVFGIGFGSPKVFWGFAWKSVKARFKDFIIVRNGRDIVTHMPPVIFGFRHLGTVFKIGKHIGLIKDHYDSNYIKGLEVLEAAVKTSENQGQS